MLSFNEMTLEGTDAEKNEVLRDFAFYGMY